MFIKYREMASVPIVMRKSVPGHKQKRVTRRYLIHLETTSLFPFRLLQNHTDGKVINNASNKTWKNPAPKVTKDLFEHRLKWKRQRRTLPSLRTTTVPKWAWQPFRRKPKTVIRFVGCSPNSHTGTRKIVSKWDRTKKRNVEATREKEEGWKGPSGVWLVTYTMCCTWDYTIS